jgi:hypothetical protein
VEGKAADFRKEAKEEGSQEHEGKTVRDILEEYAGVMGLDPAIDEELGAIRLDYVVRLNQSCIDFCTMIADEVGGVLKPAGGKLVLQKRGSGKSPSGAPLKPILIERRVCSQWRINPDGRFQYGRVEAFWNDPETGERKTEKAETGLKGPPFTIREPFSDKARAKKAAEAKTGELNRSTASGSFTVKGFPEAQAGAPLRAVGFRAGIDGDWTCAAVEHVFEPGPNGGYTTELEVKAPEKGRKEKNDD